MIRFLMAVLTLVLPFSVLGAAQALPPKPVPGPIPLSLPDLVVKEVVIFRGSGEFPAYTFRITIANIGKADAGPSQTGLIAYTLFNVTKPMELYLLGQVDTPAIPAGAEVTVVFTTPGTLRSKEYICVIADFPTKANPLGAVLEIGETNNALTIPLDTSKGTFPRSYKG